MKPEIVDKVRERARVRKEAGRAATGEQDPWSCDEIPPPLFYEGIEQFNRGEYFQQHETLEEIWAAEAREIRLLYQGILKIGVGFYKLRLGNYRGTVNHIAGGIAYLQRFGDMCMGVDIARLIEESGAVRDQVVRLGPDRTSELGQIELPRVRYISMSE